MEKRIDQISLSVGINLEGSFEIPSYPIEGLDSFDPVVEEDGPCSHMYVSPQGRSNMPLPECSQGTLEANTLEAVQPLPPTSKDDPPIILLGPDDLVFVQGKRKPALTPAEYDVINVLLNAGSGGLSLDNLAKESGHSAPHKILTGLRKKDPDWAKVIIMPGVPWRRYQLLRNSSMTPQ
jgi:hypothetical protein